MTVTALKLKPLNFSGITPTEYKVVILPKDVGKQHKFKGADGREYSLEKPETTTDRDQFAQNEGTVIAISPLAFSYATKEEWGDNPPIPKVGDRVSYAKFAGAIIKGKDGKDYRVVNDKDIYAVFD